MKFSIRLATIEDALLLSDLGRRLFYEAFGSAKSAEDMKIFLAENYNESKQSAELADPKRITYIAFAPEAEIVDRDEAPKPVGYVTLVEKTQKSGVRSDRPLQLHRLYVDGAYHGKGLAPRLMDLAVSSARERHYSSLWLTVWVNNQRAKKFYEKFGFERVGAAHFVIGKTNYTDEVL